MKSIVSQNNPFSQNTIIKLKNKEWLDKQRVAGKVVAQTLNLLENLVKEKSKLSLLEMDKVATEFIVKNNCKPTFLNYKGFPAAVCMSVNKVLTHGIPSDYYLKDGDIISFDLGATFEETIADAAITCIYGDPKSQEHIDLVRVTEESLLKGIGAISVGSRVGVIGEAISKHARKHNFGVISQYGGHGICRNADGTGMPHAAPFISNDSTPDEGVRIAPGLAIAIEPLLCIGSPKTKVLNDGWSVVTENISAHFEHSIFIHENSVEILTDRNNV
jgi:methionyl aminopeptidase